jgi:hypothetical protein
MSSPTGLAESGVIGMSGSASLDTLRIERNVAKSSD